MGYYYAIVFNQDRPLGIEPDPKQHWKKGDLYSTGSVIDRAKLPKHFDVIDLPGQPGDGDTWDATARRFVTRAAE